MFGKSDFRRFVSETQFSPVGNGIHRKWSCPWFILSLLVALAAPPDAYGQSPTSSRKNSFQYRTLLPFAGAGGGLALGLLAGMAAYDDAMHSDRKVWTLAAITGGGGAIGGYFLGRALDLRSGDSSPKITRQLPEKWERSLRFHGRIPWMSASPDTKPFFFDRHPPWEKGLVNIDNQAPQAFVKQSEERSSR